MCPFITSQLSRPRQQVFRGQTGRKLGTEATGGGLRNFHEGVKEQKEGIADILASATSHSSVLVRLGFWFKNACVLKRGLLKVENISELAPQGVSQIVCVQIDCSIAVGNPPIFFSAMCFMASVLKGFYLTKDVPILWLWNLPQCHWQRGVYRLNEVS